MVGILGCRLARIGSPGVPALRIDPGGMRAIGRWMKTNAESIHGTRASEFASLPWGRSTTKGNTRYFHVFDWPADGRLVVPRLTALFRSARLLGGGTLKTTERGAARLVINLPSRPTDPIASVVAVELR
jgi:alpha-L-fucosidase